MYMLWPHERSLPDGPSLPCFYFPGGGELGYLVVAPEHRRCGLGAALIAAAVRRLRQGVPSHISWSSRRAPPSHPPYLRAGFQPFIHVPELAERWRSVFATLGREPRELDWPTRLSDS